jgi:hypothetical protein
MMVHKSSLVPLILCLILASVTLSCGLGSSRKKILVEKEIEVPGGGNTAEVIIHGEVGQRILITLEAKNSPVEPYGYLTYPDGSGEYLPSIDTIREGKNSAEITLSQKGDYTLAVMDGSNEGGTVYIKVEVLD